LQDHLCHRREDREDHSVPWFRDRARVRDHHHHRHPAGDPPLHHPLSGWSYYRRGPSRGTRRDQPQCRREDRVGVDHHQLGVRCRLLRALRAGGLRALRLRHHRSVAINFFFPLNAGKEEEEHYPK
ncbi:unnamed protein product, partial [Ectocarpus sp. 12 AP-2014]